MNWLSRFLPGGGPALATELQTRLKAALAAPQPDLGRSHFETRYVVVNSETATTEGGGQRLVAVGAVAICQCSIQPSDAFHAPLGSVPADTLIGLLEFIGRDPVVVFNAPFNQGILHRAFEHYLHQQPELDWLDLMILMPSLYPERIAGQARMDAWLGAFGVERLDQRHALLEALAVAQLHLVALSRANAQGLPTPRELLDTQSSRKWLRGSG
ncbi:3'-5' exonuclease [Zoogloea sp.]|uniref:3'-5' exonuclease n=1 Tax=Zoogloea sp. TaxID=49181 RepID=UPI00262E3C15|nr:3'-5' exonuclease [Zoogloea sp.]MDD3354096.1 3'-5' exonuclease [Zoogloea sp.]